MSACGGKEKPECREHSDCADDQICDQKMGRCVQNVCGDGVIRQDEVCDEGADNSDTASNACRTDCQPARCGDGVVDTGETCDASTSNGVSPSPCRSDCQVTTCGDGYLGGDEVCDGTDLVGATCSSLVGLTSGAPTCAEDCLSIHTSDCYICGDGEIDGPEVCDGENVGTDTCVSLGHDGGDLACASSCLTVDPSGCYTCGDGLCEHTKGESCQACPQDCCWAEIACGNVFTCGLKADGSVWCWGGNTYGVLGNGTTDPSSEPVRVHDLNDVTSVSTGAYHTCALKTNGDVWCWGRNTNGTLGDGTIIDSPIPVKALVTNVVSLSGGENYTCATVYDGTFHRVVCWGSNTYGQLGTGDTEPSVVPLYLTTPMTNVSTSFQNTCAIRVSDSKPMCWGNNGNGQLGNGTTDPSLSPVLVNPPDSFTVKSVAVSSFTTCAVTASDSVRCWGAGALGQLGNGTWTTSSTTPVDVTGLPAATLQLSAGFNNFCVRVNDAQRTAYCWGTNLVGRLGDGTEDNRNVPVQVLNLTNLVHIDAGSMHTCAVADGGAAHCWGDGHLGQLGAGPDIHYSYTPVQVIDPYGP